ncbi:PPR domain-containing protein/PPR_1 domain-containing protein/PPR_2 domain-containing protein, partial [Cephalotus follicularis]
KRMVDDCFVVAGIDYRTIINALCKDGLVEASEMFFCRVLKLGFDLDTHICTSLVLGYCRRRNILGAFKVFAIMSRDVRCGPNSVTFSTLIHGLCEVGRLEEAFVLKEEMSEMGCQPTTRTYTVLIKALCDIGSMDKALSLLEEMVSKRCKPNIYTYTVLIDGLCKNKKLEEANGIFRKMLNDGLFPGLVTYNALINGYCKEGEIVSAFELLSVMEKRNCKPNILTYNELMEGLCRVNKTYKAMSLLRQIIDDGLLPNGVTYNILINGFCKEGKLGMAFKIFYSINSFGLESDPYTFTEMIDGLCKKGRLELANGILCLMIKKGILLDEVIFTALIDGYCKIGKTGDALMLFEKMGVSTYLKSPHVLNSFLDALSNENELNVVYAMLGKFMKYGLAPSVVTYTILIDALSKAGKITHSLNMMEEMKQAGCPPNVYTYTVIINGLCQNGRVEEAESLLYIMSDMGVSPNCITYTILVKAHVTAGRLDRAFEIVSTMIENGCQPNRRTYSALLVGIVTSNMASAAGRDINHLEARSLASEENATESISNSVLRAMDVEHALKLRAMIENFGTCNAIIVAMINAKRYNDAICLFQHLFQISDADRPTVASFNLLLKAYLDAGRVEMGYVVYNHVLNNLRCAHSTVIYRVLTKGLIEKGRVYDALDILRDMLRYGGEVDSIVYNNVIKGFLDIDDIGKANGLFEELKGKCAQYDGVLHATFMDWFFKKGQAKEGMEMYQSLLDRGISKMNPNTGNILLSVLLKHGKESEAWKLFDQMLGNHIPPIFHAVNSNSYNIMVNECFKSGKYSEAIQVFRMIGKQQGSKPFAMDISGYNNIITNLCENNLLVEAETLFEELISSTKSLSPDAITYRTLI